MSLIMSTTLGRYSPPPLLYPNTHEQTITIASGKVSSDLTSFVVGVDLSGMSAGFWAKVKADGGDIRVVNASDAAIPFDLVWIDTGTETGTLFLRDTVLTGSSNSWKIQYGSSSFEALAAGAANGRNDTWQDYELVYLLKDDLVDRSGNNDLVINTGSASYVSNAKGWGGGLAMAADFEARVTNLVGSSTTFTMSASGHLDDQTGANRQILGYLATIGSDSGRCNLGFHNTGSDFWTNWDVSNSWNDGSVVVTATDYRWHGVWDGTTEKELYLDGVTDALDSTITAIGSSNDTFVVGNAGNGSSNWNGDIAFVYLRLEALSANWISAEVDNLVNAATFYSLAAEAAI